MTMTDTIEYELTNLDRCDACGAQALVRVRGVSGELLFCGHHYTKNEAALIEFAYEILDEREKINPKPMGAY